jgi:hypothetical protein
MALNWFTGPLKGINDLVIIFAHILEKVIPAINSALVAKLRGSRSGEKGSGDDVDEFHDCLIGVGVVVKRVSRRKALAIVFGRIGRLGVLVI